MSWGDVPVWAERSAGSTAPLAAGLFLEKGSSSMSTRRNGGKGRPTSSLPPAAGLVTGRDAAARVNGRLASREWWLLVTCEQRGNGLLAHLERTYYAGEAGRDFEVVILP